MIMYPRNLFVKTLLLCVIWKFSRAERSPDYRAAYKDQREHPEENSGRFEGDIVLDRRTKDQLLGRGTRNEARDAIIGNSNRWPGGIMYYTLHRSLPSKAKRMIKRAMRHVTASTRCIRFRERRNQRDYVRFIRGSGCYSYIGRRGGRQDISIGRGCDSKLGIPVHEILHALGFYHEQSRRDRNQYVTVNAANIRAGTKNNFRVHAAGRASTLGFAYDYGSVMHYSRFAFSKNGKPTIVPKKAGAKIGQREKLSKIDIQQIRRLYSCT